ncbi:hypothetical protein ABZ070_33190 [Streptomyces sp. NPDC006283]|uniref:hypothetical protein n=1 Tax=Streptomyces sp. NPDC006283 TaxID=3156741 RepID=UPI0033A35725
MTSQGDSLNVGAAMLDEADVKQKFERQWERCVAYAAKLLIPQESLEWTEGLATSSHW